MASPKPHSGADLTAEDFTSSAGAIDLNQWKPSAAHHKSDPSIFAKQHSVPLIKKPVPSHPHLKGPQAYGHPAKEEHAIDKDDSRCSSDFVKSMLFGGLDGIITTFAIIAASVGAGYSFEKILLLGISKILADATSMGVGDFISERAELDYHRSEMKREQHELIHKPNAERLEMIEIYMKKGMTEEHAGTVVDILMKNDQLLDVMMVDELGIFPPDEDANPLKNGAVTFCSFVAFGSVPLWLYAICLGADYGNLDVEGTTTREYNTVFGLAIMFTLLTLFSLGAVNAQITKQPKLKAGLMTMLNGGAATALSYLIGWALERSFLS